MTKFLNESGFRRIIKTIKNALSLKADKSELPLLVTYTGSQCDTSIADIYAAFLAGRNVEMNYGYMFKLSLVQCSEEVAIFSANFSDQSIGLKGTISNGVDTWEFIVVDLQERLTSGTNIKTVNHESVLGSGNVNLNGSNIDTAISDPNGDWVAGESIDDILAVKSQALADLEDKVDTGLNKRPIIVDYYHYADMIADSSQRGGTIAWEGDNECFYIYETANDEWRRIDNEELNQITSITTTESTASGGNNTVTITETDGTTTTFNVKNGKDGADGVSLGEVALVQTTGDATDAVMSQKAVTEYGRKVTAEDLNGTSDWIKARLTEEGWEFGKVLNNDGTVGGTSNWMCISPMFPCSTNHSFLFQPKKSNNSGNCMLAFYNDSDAFKGSTTVAVIDGTQTYTPTDSTITQLRFSCNMNDLPNVFVKDTTTDEYIFKGDEVVKNLIANSGNIVSYDVLEGSIIKHTSGESSISLMSQRAITDAIAKQNGFEASEGMATINYFPVYTKLTQRQVERLNSGEVATFHILAKPVKSHPSGMYGANFFMSRDSLGYSIYQNAGSIIVNGITIVTYNTIGMFPVSRYFVCDRVNGVVRLYTGTKLLAEVQNDSFKKDKFIGDDGIFYFHSGYYKAVLYEMKIFDFDAFSLSYNDTIFDYNLRDAEVATMNPDSVKNALNLFDTTVYTKNKPTVATNNAQYSRTTDSEGYSTISVSPTATTTCILQQNPHNFDTSNGNVRKYGQSMVKEIIFDLEVISGNINLATNIIGDALEIKKVIDESGNIIDDASNCGIGVYHIHIITSNPNTGIIKSAGVSCVFRLLSASIKMLCCVAHLSFNKWYNGEIYDDEADTYYHLYSDASLSKEPTNVALSPEVARRSGTLKLNYPQFIGQIAITSSGIFIGNQDYTWKQINNS